MTGDVVTGGVTVSVRFVVCINGVILSFGPSQKTQKITAPLRLTPVYLHENPCQFVNLKKLFVRMA